MKYPFSKQQYLNIQDKLYDEFGEILKENIIVNIEYKLIKRNPLYTSNNEVIKANINAWLQEIHWLRNNIVEELMLCLAYNKISDKFSKSVNSALMYLNRERYLRLVVYDLFTFREKLAFLIHEMFNKQIKLPIKVKQGNSNKISKLKKLNKNQVSFDKIVKGLKVFNIYEENITWINEEEFELISSIMHKFSCNEHIKVLKDIRHAFIHRSNPGIDCLTLRSFQYSISEPLEKEIPFDDIISDVLNVWELFAVKFKFLLENVSILRNEIECFY